MVKFSGKSALISTVIILSSISMKSALGADTCKLSPEYVQTGGIKTSFGIDYSLNPMASKQFTGCAANLTCASSTHTYFKNGPQVPDTGSDPCYVVNRGTQHAYGCDQISETQHTSSSAVTIDDLKKAYQQYLVNLNKRTEPTQGMTTTLIDMKCTADSFFLDKDAFLGDQSEPIEQCSTGQIQSLQHGSIIDCRDKSLGQSLSVSGTPFSLNYTTNNTSGAKGGARTLNFYAPSYDRPITVDAKQWVLSSIVINIEIAGIPFTHTFLPSQLSASQPTPFAITWSGKDSAGKLVQGPVQVSKTTQYNYKTGWTNAPISLSNKQIVILSSVDSNQDFKIGGWSLDLYHFYDVDTQTVYMGNGLRMKNKAATVKPAFDNDGYYNIPDLQGTLIYKFDADGRHISTRQALSGVILYKFNYDAKHQLISIADKNGLLYKLGRDGNGRLLSLTNPYGIETQLEYDAAGNLSSITDPMGHKSKFTYKGSVLNGPLESFTNAAGQVKNYTYDANGLLSSASDFNGGVKKISAVTKTAGGNSRTMNVSFSSPMGRQTKYQTTVSSDSSLYLVNTNPDGSETFQSNSYDDLHKEISDSTGKISKMDYELDPVFTGAVHLTNQQVSAAGGGRLRQSVTYALDSSKGDPFAIKTAT